MTIPATGPLSLSVIKNNLAAQFLPTNPSQPLDLSPGNRLSFYRSRVVVGSSNQRITLPQPPNPISFGNFRGVTNINTSPYPSPIITISQGIANQTAFAGTGELEFIVSASVNWRESQWPLNTGINPTKNGPLFVWQYRQNESSAWIDILPNTVNFRINPSNPASLLVNTVEALNNYQVRAIVQAKLIDNNNEIAVVSQPTANAVISITPGPVTLNFLSANPFQARVQRDNNNALYRAANITVGFSGTFSFRINLPGAIGSRSVTGYTYTAFWQRQLPNQSWENYTHPGQPSSFSGTFTGRTRSVQIPSLTFSNLTNDDLNDVSFRLVINLVVQATNPVGTITIPTIISNVATIRILEEVLPPTIFSISAEARVPTAAQYGGSPYQLRFTVETVSAVGLQITLSSTDNNGYFSDWSEIGFGNLTSQVTYTVTGNTQTIEFGSIPPFAELKESAETATALPTGAGWQGADLTQLVYNFIPAQRVVEIIPPGPYVMNEGDSLPITIRSTVSPQMLTRIARFVGSDASGQPAPPSQASNQYPVNSFMIRPPTNTQFSGYIGSNPIQGYYEASVTMNTAVHSSSLLPQYGYILYYEGNEFSGSSLITLGPFTVNNIDPGTVPDPLNIGLSNVSRTQSTPYNFHILTYSTSIDLIDDGSTSTGGSWASGIQYDNQPGYTLAVTPVNTVIHTPRDYLSARIFSSSSVSGAVIPVRRTTVGLELSFLQRPVGAPGTVPTVPVSGEALVTVRHNGNLVGTFAVTLNLTVNN